MLSDSEDSDIIENDGVEKVVVISDSSDSSYDEEPELKLQDADKKDGTLVESMTGDLFCFPALHICVIQCLEINSYLKKK